MIGGHIESGLNARDLFKTPKDLEVLVLKEGRDHSLRVSSVNVCFLALIISHSLWYSYIDLISRGSALKY